MALEISYYDGADAITRTVYNRHVGGQSFTLSASAANSAVVPDRAAVARIRAGENCRYVKNTDGTVNATASTGQYLAAGESIDVMVTPGKFFNALTV